MTGAGAGLAGAAGGAAVAASGFLTWAVRGRSAQVFGRSVWRGPRGPRALALTFDDGPSEATPQLLEILARHRTPATFFQCGANVERLPEVARAVAGRGHEIGNHSLLAPLLLFPFGAVHRGGDAPGAVGHRRARRRAPGLVSRPLWRALVRPGRRSDGGWD